SRACPAVAPGPPLQVHHAGPRLPLIPGGAEPPAVARSLLQPELQQPQQGHRQQLQLRGAQDRLLGLGAALLPAQPLLEVAEAILLAEAAAEDLQQLQPAQVAGAADQREPLRVALDLGDDDLDRDVGAGHAPQAHDLLPADGTPAAVQPGLALLPGPRPATALPRRRQAPAPLAPPAAAARRPLRRRPGMQAGVAAQARQELDAGLPRLGVD